MILQALPCRRGANSVGELLKILGDEVDPNGRDGPVVLVNGRQVNSLQEAADLPTEALVSVQLLPAEAAARLGQSPSRRVISVVLKTHHKQATLLAERGQSTGGGGAINAGEINLLRASNANRDSLVVRVRDAAALLENERGVRPDVLALPYDLLGNLVAQPQPGLGIDPALSLANGGPVTVVGLSGLPGKPTMAQLLARANRANATDNGGARTLQPQMLSRSVNGNVTRQVGEGTLSLNIRGEWIDADGLGGLFAAMVPVPRTSPFAPVASDSAIARFAQRPLEQGNRSFNLDVGGNFAAPLGKWQVTGLVDINHRINRAANDLSYDLSGYLTAVAAGVADPFAPIVVEDGQVRRSTTRYRSDQSQAQLVASGRLFRLPAGTVLATVKAGIRRERAVSNSSYNGFDRSRRHRRDEDSAQVTLQVPLLAGSARAGAVGLDLAGAVRRVTAVGTLLDYEATLNALAAPGINLRATAKREEVAPSAEALSDPLLASDNYRIFDFASNQTVLVRYLGGGNPDLPVAAREVLSAGLTADLTRQLKLSGEYTHRVVKGGQGTLPPNSATVQAAFPDRYQRDQSGKLVQVDGRPVSFLRETADQLHWGLDLRTALGRQGAIAARGTGAATGFSGGDSARLQLSIDHYWLLRSTRQARPGLQVVDMLAGGAAGYGSGTARHSIRLNASLASGGVGVQLAAAWRSRSTIRVADVPSSGDLTFAAHGTLDVRGYADLGTLFRSQPVLAGTRLSLRVDNLLAAHQQVRDASGAQPQRYQSALLDPQGRNFLLSLRKVF